MDLQPPPPKYSTFDFDIENVKLSNSPQDDYQRIFFTTLFEKFYSQDIDAKVKNKLSINELFIQQLKINSTTYRSSIAKDLENPNYLTDETNMENARKKREVEKNFSAANIATTSTSNSTGKQTRRRSSTRKEKGNETLKCFEYKFPDLKIYLDDNNNINKKFTINEQSLKKIPIHIRSNLGIDKEFCMRQMLDANVVFKDTNTLNNNNSTSLPSSVSSSVSLSEMEDKKTIIPKDNVSAAMNTLTKNQQFKVTKLDHNDASNNKLISKNNTVLWEYDTGYVFLTGIWRLYQDIIRGLILCDRRDTTKEQNKLIRDKCIREYEYISSYAFYESINLDIDENPSIDQDISQYQDSSGRQRKRRSITNPSNANLANIGIQVDGKKKSSTDGTNKINYSDLHWNEISDILCDIVRDDFKNHLIQDQKIPLENIDVDGKNINDLGKRIRGGFIKIQGTWQPMRIAKRMCYRFCYPIRYLLTPLFGPDFVPECEKWYKAIEHHAEKMAEERKRTGFVGPMRSKKTVRKITPKNSNTSSPRGKRKASFSSSTSSSAIHVGPDSKRPTLRDPFSGNDAILTPTRDMITIAPIQTATPESSVNSNSIPRVYVANTRHRCTQSLPSIQGIISSVQHIPPPPPSNQQHLIRGGFPHHGRNSVPNVHFAPFVQQIGYYPPQPLIPQVINQHTQRQQAYLPPPHQTTTVMDPAFNRTSTMNNFRTPTTTDRYNLTYNGNMVQSRNSISNQSSNQNSNLTTPQTPDVNILSAATNLYNTGGHRYSYPPKVKVSQIEPSSKFDFAPHTHLTYIGTPKLSDVPRSSGGTVTGSTNQVPRIYNRELPRIIPQAYISAAQYQVPLQSQLQQRTQYQTFPQSQQPHQQLPHQQQQQQQQQYYHYQFQQPH